MSLVYLIGSLRNPQIPEYGNQLREAGFDVFDSWYAPGPKADDHWRDYCQRRGLSYQQSLKDYSATHIFEFDKFHIDRSDIGVLAYPAGKSGHLELGYMIGRGKTSYIVFPEGEPPKDRWDVMLQFANAVCFSMDELITTMHLDLNYRENKLYNGGITGAIEYDDYDPSRDM
jgi:nucleoside 2-deoxyribosyltransferase